MRKPLSWAIVLLAPLLAGAAGSYATLTWTLPTTYSDNAPVLPEDTRRIIVKVYSGPARSGPWRWIATSEPGGTSATVPGPAPLETRWYTARAELHGSESEYADPVWKTNLSIPDIPRMKSILKRLLAMKRWIILLLLFLLAGLAGYVRYRGRRAKQ